MNKLIVIMLLIFSILFIFFQQNNGQKEDNKEFNEIVDQKKEIKFFPDNQPETDSKKDILFLLKKYGGGLC